MGGIHPEVVRADAIDSVVRLVDQLLDAISEWELTAVDRQRFEGLEDPLGERIDARIEQSEFASCWLFDQLGYLVAIELDGPIVDGLRAFDDRQCGGGVCVGFTACLDNPMVDDLVAVDQQKRAAGTIAGLEQGMTTAELIVLGVVCNRDITVGRPEMR